MWISTIGSLPEVCESLARRGISISGNDLTCEHLLSFMPIVPLSPIAEIRSDEWLGEFNACVKETFFQAKTWLGSALERGSGTWVAVTPSAGQRPFISGGALGASVAALQTLVKVTAIEGGPFGVRANSLAVSWPGAVSPELDHDLMEADSPLRGSVTAEDVTSAIAWLLSDSAAQVSGAVIPVDGGYSMTRGSRTDPRR